MGYILFIIGSLMFIDGGRVEDYQRLCIYQNRRLIYYDSHPIVKSEKKMFAGLFVCAWGSLDIMYRGGR